ncbi:MAG: hypothetical protein ACKOEG_05035, partial [Chthoniobacterales bacterium]
MVKNARGKTIPQFVVARTTRVFARRDTTSEGFREELGEAARKYSRRPVNDELWNRFAASIFYHRSSFDDPSGYLSLGKEL